MLRHGKSLTRALCGSAAISLAVPLFSLLAVSTSFAQPSQNTGNIVDGHGVLPERRIRAYTYLGGDEHVIRQTVARITRQDGDAPGSWVYEWRVLGEYFENLGDTLAKRGPHRAAIDAYVTSVAYYGLAWFPRITNAEEAKAYDQQLRAYQKAGKLSDVPLEVVKVPFRDGVITTYLHKPVGVEKPPLVLYAGGVDQYKANHYRAVQDFLHKGLAVATFDLPGFGESRQWGRDSTSAPHLALLDHYVKRTDIDTTRISLFGQSYGAGASLRAALRNDSRVKSVVAFCGAMHLGTDRSLAPNAKVGDKIINGPLLVVNGTRDPGSPVDDLMSTYQAAKEGDIWLLGLGEHCAVEYYPTVMPHVAQWVVEKNAK
ncbi:MAG: alpha/beta fold hydrolase [Acidobacteriota bacterium]